MMPTLRMINEISLIIEIDFVAQKMLTLGRDDCDFVSLSLS
jgi:hypothetical protein